MHTNKPDIHTEQDVELMVNSFYAKVNQDPLLSYVFNDFAEVDWQSHLPKMYQFWNTLIFGEQSYKGNPFAAHVPLPVDQSHLCGHHDLVFYAGRGLLRPGSHFAAAHERDLQHFSGYPRHIKEL